MAALTYSTTSTATTISVVTQPDPTQFRAFEEIPNSVFGVVRTCSDSFNCPNPAQYITAQNRTFTVSGLVPRTTYYFDYTMSFNGEDYNSGTWQFYGNVVALFSASTIDGVAPAGSVLGPNNPPASPNLVGSDPTLYALFSILAVIPIGLLLLFAIVVMLILCIALRRKKSKSSPSSPPRGKETELKTVLVQQTPDGSVESTLKENFSKQYILDYNKIVFATQLLGSGAQGTVYKGTYLMMDVAVKLLNTQQFGSQNDLSDFYNEAKLLSEHSNHPNIVKFIGIAHKPETHQIALITEYCPMGNLANTVESTEFNWRQKCSILFGIACGMTHLHLNNIIHRGFKAENVLLDSALCAKIIDFGFSKQIQDMNKTMNMTMNVGTATYVAPEVIKTMQTPITTVAPSRRKSTATANTSSLSASTAAGSSSANTSLAQSSSAPTDDSTTDKPHKKRQYDMNVDVYSFAIIMWVVYYSNKYPYGHQASDFQVIHSISTNPDFGPVISDDVPKEEQWYIELMKQCWATNPEDRPSFETISTILKRELDKLPK